MEDDAEVFGYWLASSSVNGSSDVVIVGYDGLVYGMYCYDNCTAIRPVVSLKSEILGTKTEDVWELSK